MAKSKIEWTDYTWNVVTGCTKVSEGCRNCYAERDFHRPYPGREFNDIKLHTERLGEPLKLKKPHKIFVCSMGDLFHEMVPFEFITKIFIVINHSPENIYQILTKRPERMYEFYKHYSKYEDDSWIKNIENVWLGVSVEDQKTANERIPLLLQIPSKIKFVSCEPLLGPIDLNEYLGPYFDEGKWLDWVIVGGESGPKARYMDPEWARSIRDQCIEARVPFFMKQMTKKESIPEDLFIRIFPG